MKQDFLKRKEIIIGVGFVAANLLILFFGVWFITSKIVVSNQELKEQKAALAAIYQGWQQMGHEQKELQGIEPQLKGLDDALLRTDEPVEFISTLENLAQKTDNLFQISLISGALKEKSENQIQQKSVSFQVSLAGSFANFMHFLRYLENMKYYTSVESIQIGQAGGAGLSQKLEWKEIPAGSVLSTINIKVFAK